MYNVLFILVLALLISGCNEFTGYDYEADSVGDRSHLYGTVVNSYNTDQPVINAKVQFGYLTTYTDSTGNFDVEYILSADDNRNKPVELLVSAPDYLDLITNFIVEIPEQKFNLNLDYGAPEIEKIWIGARSKIIHQVIVTDFQGVDNIDSVTTVFYYTHFVESEVRTIPVTMNFMGTEPGSDVSLQYQATSARNLGDGWYYNDRWINFTVWDNDGFSDTITRKYSNIMSPDSLFPTGIALPDTIDF